MDLDEVIRDVSPRRLTAGRLTAELDAPDLTHIRLGGVEIVRRLLVTVRDTNWDTLKPEVLSASVSEGEGVFEVEVEGRHVADEIDFRWRASIRADGTGRVLYELDGVAHTDFKYSRIGLCVLHPVSTCAGARYRSSAEETSHSGVLALDITPQVVNDGIPIALFAPCDALELEPAAGGRISFAFRGDRFEMEDQRNWTDDSFKTYCTPASLGVPHTASEGKRIRQSVEVRASGFGVATRAAKGPITVSLGPPTRTSVPSLGIAMGAEGALPTDAEAEALRRLGLAHVRADVKIEAPTVDTAISHALDVCARTGAALELALHLEQVDELLLEQADAVLRASNTRVARILAFHREARSESPSETTSAALAQLVRRRLGHVAPVGGGTNMDFAELNRTRPDAPALQTVAWAMNAQVHASDDISVMETLRGQTATVATARSFCRDCRFALGPITLRPRFNPAATGPPVARDDRDPPAHVDPRQGTQFCAAWTAGSVAGLALAGVESLTYFELVGMAGVMTSAADDGHPDYPKMASRLFPVYHVLQALAPLRGRQLLQRTITPDSHLDVLATTARIVIVNLSSSDQRVLIEGLPWPTARTRLPNQDPDTRDGTLVSSERSVIDLEPYAVMLLEPARSTLRQ